MSRRMAGVGVSGVLLVSIASVGLASCSGAQPEGAGTAADETFTGWTMSGVTLHRSCQEADDRSSCGVWGTDDATGSRLSGEELFQRLPSDTSAAVLASRAQDLLLGRSGQEPLDPEAAATSSFVSEGERSVITAPRLEENVLVFYALEGEMHPTAMELRVDRRTSSVTRTPVVELWVERADADEGPLCLPLVRCGCDDGCARVDRVTLPNGNQRFRRLDGRTPRILYRVEGSGSLEALNESCTEACPPHAAAYTCTLDGEACTEGPPAPTATPTSAAPQEEE
ncbi:MAG: hypothetical protein J0L92_21940 [Deltaproteobacteria bacterium]|nr:hypothetical protein [Deltaproteobacteria bacterium]